MKLLSIDHVTLHVRDLDTVRLYYEQVFGFSCTERETPDGRNLQLEKATVHFFLAEEPTIDADSVNRQHISFEVESLGPVIALLEARGEPYELGQYSGFKSRSYRWCEWRDPAGIRIECVERMEA